MTHLSFLLNEGFSVYFQQLSKSISKRDGPPLEDLAHGLRRYLPLTCNVGLRQAAPSHFLMNEFRVKYQHGADIHQKKPVVKNEINQ